MNMRAIHNIQSIDSFATGDTVHIKNIILQWLKLDVEVERISVDE